MEAKKILFYVFVYGLSFIFAFANLILVAYKYFKNGSEIFKKRERKVPPPILLDSRWGSHQYITLKKQGIKLHYVEKGDRSKPLILCLHGFPECWLSWRHQLEEFSSQYWVVALNMRGYGDSDKPPRISDYSLDILVEDVRQFILESGKTQCTLLGHDWGGIVAWGLVERHPELVKRHVTLNGPHIQIFINTLRSSFKQFCMSWYMFFFQCPFVPEFTSGLRDMNLITLAFRGKRNLVKQFPDEVLEGYKYYFGQEGGLKYPINYYRSNLTALETGQPERVSVPTLIIWGTDDNFLSKDFPKQMAAICEDVQIKMVDGAGHFVQSEEPKHVNDLMWEYFRLTEAT